MKSIAGGLRDCDDSAMRQLLASLSALLAIACGPALADCPTVVGAPDISVTTEWTGAQLIRELDAAELPARRGTTGAFPGARQRQLGLTSWQVAVRSRFLVSEIAGSPGCFALKKVEAVVDANPVKVFVARELKDSSCPYRVTVRHEQRHVEIVRQSVAALAIDLRRGLDGPALARVMPAPDVDIAVQRFSAAINLVTGDARRRIEEQAARRNGELDSPGSYRAEEAKCPRGDWIDPFR